MQPGVLTAQRQQLRVGAFFHHGAVVQHQDMVGIAHGADPVADDHSEREKALRKLPLPYSLALRLRDAGVAREVVCEYVGVEEAALDGLYRIAEAKLIALQK